MKKIFQTNCRLLRQYLSLIVFFYSFNLICFAGINPEKCDDEELSPLDSEVIAEINCLRNNPSEYIRYLKELEKYFSGHSFQKKGQMKIKTKEGIKAVKSAVIFLKKVKPVHSLKIKKGLSKAAEMLVKSGLTGHRDKNGNTPRERAAFFGKVKGKTGENISYGYNSGRDIVLSFLIDDGVFFKGHRKSIFDNSYHYIGVSSGTHPVYRNMCVVLLAEEYND